MVMLFKSLLLRNFKSYEHASVDFNKGVSIVIGENGAGKSSIFEAVNFALYKKQRGVVDDLVRRNRSGAPYKMSVRLEFVVGSEVYRVTREREKNKTNSILEKCFGDGDYHQLCTGDKLVNDTIQDILKMDSNLFENAIYIKQGQIADLLNQTKAERDTTIGKLLEADSLEQAWKNMPELKRKYETQETTLSTRIEDLDSKKEEYNQKLETCQQIKDELIQLNTQLEAVEKELDGLVKSKELLDGEKEKFEQLNNKIKTNDTLIKEYQTNIGRLEDDLDNINSSEKSMSELEPSISKLPDYKNFQEIVNNIGHLESDYNREIDKRRKLDELEKIIETTETHYQEYQNLDKKIKEYDSKLEKLKRELHEKSLLEHDRKNKKDELATNQDTLNSVLGEIKDILKLNKDLNSLDECTKLCDMLETPLKEEITGLEKDLQDKDNEITGLKYEITSADKALKELDELDDQCPVCGSDIDSVQKNELKISNNQIISENTERIGVLEGDKEEISGRLTLKNTGLASVDNARERISSSAHLLTTIEKLSERINTINTELEAYVNIQETHDEIESIITESSKQVEELLEDYEKYKNAELLKNEYNTIEIETKVTELKNQINRQTEEKTIIQNKHKDINPETLTETIKQLEEDQIKYNQLKGQVSNKTQVEEQLTKKKEELKKTQEENKQLEEQVKENTYNPETYKEITEQISEKTKVREELLKNQTEKGTQEENLKTQLKELKNQITQKEEDKKELEKTESFIEFIDHVRSFYHRDGVQSELRRRSLPLIQKYTQEYFQQFNFNYSNLTITDDYEIQLNNGESSLNMASGGEEIGIALALRLGIAKVAAKGKIETILLDEPTIHLDEYRRGELINILTILDIPQMIIVTHDSELEAAASNIIKVHKENGISQIGD